MRCFPCFGADATDTADYEAISEDVKPVQAHTTQETHVEPGPRSVHDRLQKPLTFHNLTTRKVVVIWLDYQGREVVYAEVASDGHFGVNTYLSHPWIIRDYKTGQRISMITHSGPEKERLNTPSQLVVVADDAPASFVSIV